MRIAFACTVLLMVGYAIGGGEFGILDSLCEVVWLNPLGESIHDAVLSVDDDRLADLYFGLRMEFHYGAVALLFGFITSMLLSGRLALLPCMLVIGIVVRMVVPVLIELAARGKLALASKLLPDFVWDVAMIPTCALGIGIARLVTLRRFPRWQIKTAAAFTLVFALFLAAVAQHWSLLLPITFCGLVLVLSIWLLRQSDTIIGISSNHPMHGRLGTR